MGPLLTGVDSDKIQLAFSTLLDVITENREALREGGRVFAKALTRVSTMLDSEDDFVRLQQFLSSLTNLVIRIDDVTDKNEDVLVAAIKDAGATMGDLKIIMARLKTVSKDFPAYATDATTLLHGMGKVMKNLETFDTRKAGLILKKVLQQEGLTFSVRGYSMKELKKQMGEYDKILADDESALEIDCDPALIRTGDCKSTH